MNKIINQIIQSTNLSLQQAWWLLEFVTDKTRTELQYSSVELSHAQQAQLDEYIKQINVHHKPLAYILGWVPFLDLKLLVQPPTLIPRPETESWVDELIILLRQGFRGHVKKSNHEKLTILDIGTGSGCIALSLAQSFPQSQVYALDIAHSALELAQKNAELNQISNITFLQSDLFSNLPADIKFDLIVSNPPYIDSAVQLDQSVAGWEDHGALFAPNHGLQIIEQIIQQAKKHLKENNGLDYQLVMEIDVSQGDIVKKLLHDYNFKNIEIIKDQFDRDRTVWAK